MALTTMYAAQTNSPTTTLASAAGAADTSLIVTSAAVLPSTTPFELSLGIGEAAAETVLVTAVNGNTLTVTRGWDGTPQAWAVNTICARTFSAKDLNDIQNNIEALSAELSGLVDPTLSVSGKAADAAAVGDEFAKTLRSITTLTSSDDLNDVTAPGLYFCGRNYSGAGGFPANMPTGITGDRVRVLVVRTESSIAGAWQMVVDGAGALFYRGYSGTSFSGSWVAWSKAAAIANLPVIDSTLSVSGAAADAAAVGAEFEKTLRSVTTLTSEDDLNTVTSPGIYFCGRNYSGAAGFPDNMPSGITGDRARVLVVRTESSIAGAWQVIVDGASRFWCRGYSGTSYSGSWSAWQSYVTAQETQTNSVKSISVAIPYTAVGYHELWQPWVTAGLVKRSTASYPVSGDTNHKWPLYYYTITAEKNWMEGDYVKKVYPTNGEVYARPKVLLISGQHGSERATPIFLWEFVNRLLHNPAYAELLAKYDWTIAPLVNPWGFSHSFVDEVSGDIYRGTEWEPAGYTLFENNAENGYDGGTRCNELGLNLNRDWSDTDYIGTDGNTYGFKAAESQWLKSILLNGGFSVSVDLHQARTALQSTAANNRKCGFVYNPVNAGTGEMALRRSWVARAGAVTDRLMCDAYGLTLTQYAFPWVGEGVSANGGRTFSNYAAGLANNTSGVSVQYCGTLETCSVCYPFTNALDPYKKGATDYGNTFVDEYFKLLFASIELTEALNDT